MDLLQRLSLIHIFNLIIYFVYVFPICKTEEKRKKTYFLQKSPAYFQ